MVWRMTEDVDPEARRQRVLAAMKATGATADTSLVAALTDEDAIVREWAIEGLVRRKSGVVAVPALLERLRDGRADVRWYAARALGKLGVSTSEVANGLEAALADADEYVRSYAAWAIAGLQLHDRLPALRARLRAKGPARRDVEEHSLGLAIARLHTPVQAAEDCQPVLFSAEQLPVPSLPDRLPQTKSETLRADLLATAERVLMDRAGGTVVVSGSVRLTFQTVRSVSLKERILEERGRCCQLCGFTFRKVGGEDYAECHHVEPVGRGGQDHPDNLLVLCANHHKMLHFADVAFPSGRHRPREIVINGTAIAIRWP